LNQIFPAAVLGEPQGRARRRCNSNARLLNFSGKKLEISMVSEVLERPDEKRRVFAPFSRVEDHFSRVFRVG